MYSCDTHIALEHVQKVDVDLCQPSHKRSTHAAILGREIFLKETRATLRVRHYCRVVGGFDLVPCILAQQCGAELEVRAVVPDNASTRNCFSSQSKREAEVTRTV
jgi:hypothetical protein